MATMLNSPNLWLSQFPIPQRDGHKYDRGVALIYGGATMTGAARLAARAAQRVGAGMAVLGTSEQAYPIYAEALESVIVKKVRVCSEWEALVKDPKHDVALIGPGLGIGDGQKKLVLATVAIGKPCVLDADGLTNFANYPEQLLSKLHNQCILTPHEGEFERIFGGSISTLSDKIERAKQAAEKAKCYVLLKGAETVIAAPDGSTIINNNAPPWLATAGAGDVLAGIILGLIAQQMPLFLAIAAAAWLHGDIANRFGLGLVAEDLVEGIPAALHKLFPSMNG